MLSTKKLLYKIVSSIKTPLKVEMTTIASQNYPANGGQSGTGSVTAVTGYTPIAIVGWDVGSWNVALTRCRLGGSTLFWSARNFTSSAATTGINVYVLYIRTSLA